MIAVSDGYAHGGTVEDFVADDCIGTDLSGFLLYATQILLAREFRRMNRWRKVFVPGLPLLFCLCLTRRFRTELLLQ